MCDIPTQNPDAHATAVIKHVVSLAVTAVRSIASCVEKQQLDAFYLSELSGHEGLLQELPSQSDFATSIVAALKAEIESYKSQKALERQKDMDGRHRVYECQFPEGFADMIAQVLIPSIK